MKPEQIPDEVVETALKEYNRVCRENEAISESEALSAAIAAGLAAWPGMEKSTKRMNWLPDLPALILPLKEISDE